MVKNRPKYFQKMWATYYIWIFCAKIQLLQCCPFLARKFKCLLPRSKIIFFWHESSNICFLEVKRHFRRENSNEKILVDFQTSWKCKKYFGSLPCEFNSFLIRTFLQTAKQKWQNKWQKISWWILKPLIIFCLKHIIIKVQTRNFLVGGKDKSWEERRFLGG